MLYLSARNAFNVKLQTVKRKLNRELEHMLHECKSDVYACGLNICVCTYECAVLWAKSFVSQQEQQDQ